MFKHHRIVSIIKASVSGFSPLALLTIADPTKEVQSAMECVAFPYQYQDALTPLQ